MQRPKTAMNGTEAKYAAHLEFLKSCGDIVAYQFEAVKLKLAANTFYTPDFMVVHPGHISLHEIKGFWRDDARVKIKVAAAKFPMFEFVAVQWKGKDGWVYEGF